MSNPFSMRSQLCRDSRGSKLMTRRRCSLSTRCPNPRLCTIVSVRFSKLSTRKVNPYTVLRPYNRRSRNRWLLTDTTRRTVAVEPSPSHDRRLYGRTRTTVRRAPLINFLSRASVSSSSPAITGITFPSPSITVLIYFLQRPLPPPVHPVSNLTSTSHRRAHLQKPLCPTLHRQLLCQK